MQIAVILMKTIEKILLFATTLALICLVIILFKPWSHNVYYTFQYIRGRALELAEIIERKQSARLVESWSLEDVNLMLVVSKPNEEPLTINLSYERLKVYAPIHAREVEVIRGSPPDKHFEFFRRVSVYHAGSFIVVDPKPVVRHYIVNEYGRTSHIVEITLFRIDGVLEPGCVLSFANSSRVVFLRCYDYPGTVSVTINGQDVLTFNVDPSNVLRVIIVYEVWCARS